MMRRRLGWQAFAPLTAAPMFPVRLAVSARCRAFSAV